jgi:hypothetical protein
VTSTLANTEVEAVGLKKFTPPETSPHKSLCRVSFSRQPPGLATNDGDDPAPLIFFV